MIASKILASGKFYPQDIRVSMHKSNRAIDPTTESQIETVWQAMLAQAKEAGKVCYNGTSYRLNTLAVDAGKLVIELSTFEYKVRDGLLKIPGYFDLTEKYYRKGCFTTGTIRTSDNQYVLVKLSGRSMNENSTEMVGGIMETDVTMCSGEDIFTSFFNELEEEIGVVKDDVADIYLQTIYLDSKTNIGFYFDVTLTISANELLWRFKYNQDIDIESILTYSKDAYIQTLRDHPSRDKHFLATQLESTAAS